MTAPALHALLRLPSRRPGRLGLVFRFSGVFRMTGVFRSAGAICAAGVYDSGVTPASGVRGGSKRSTRCQTFRYRVAVMLLLGWRWWRRRWWLLCRWWGLRRCSRHHRSWDRECDPEYHE
jgi:hypothetical protein